MLCCYCYYRREEDKYKRSPGQPPHAGYIDSYFVVVDSTISKSKAGAVHVSMGLDLVVVSPIRLLRIVVRCLPLLNSRAIVHGHGCLPLPNYSYAYVVVGLVLLPSTSRQGTFAATAQSKMSNNTL